MRAWTKSACVVLAWSVLPVIVMVAGVRGSVHPAQANTRTASSTEVILTSMLSVAAVPMAARPASRYVVRSGDTLAAIAARLGVRGGWPALYALNRTAIGPDPNIIRTGTVLVLPRHQPPARYTVAAGDSLSGIAAEFAVPGGWPALYAANRKVIGPDPGLIRTGTVLTIRHSAGPPATGNIRPRPHPPAPPSASAGSLPHPLPVTTHPPAAATGMPQWLKIVLLAVGLLTLAAFLTEPLLAARRRQRQATTQQAAAQATAAQETAAQPATAEQATVPIPLPGTSDVPPLGGAAGAAVHHGPADSGQAPGCWPAAAARAHIVLADFDRLVVTRSKPDGTVYVLRPPGEDPRAILRVARLVLPESHYGELARRLGMPAIGPVE
jgi:LysM repeat protein